MSHDHLINFPSSTTNLNLLQRALIEKAGYENGFENTCATEDSALRLSSARHSSQISIAYHSDGEQLLAKVTTGITDALVTELCRSFSAVKVGNYLFLLPDISGLANFLRRASSLAQALPNQAVIAFQKEFAEATNKLSDNLKGTEVERLIKQRIGQDRFRNAMLEYWGNACAVTGISVKEVLRASHAKPWAACDTDEERLDVFNGFLLCANFDALFDRFLISFDDDGRILISPEIPAAQYPDLGLTNALSLRWITEQHCAYLDYHRSMFFKPLS